MDAIGIAVVFGITWWLVFLMALPFGVRTPDVPEPGHASSAPERPRVALKAAVTTAIAVGITGLAAVAVEYDIISFGEWVRLEP